MIGLIKYWWINVCLVNRNDKWNERRKLRSTLGYFKKKLNVDIMVDTGRWQIWKVKKNSTSNASVEVKACFFLCKCEKGKRKPAKRD